MKDRKRNFKIRVLKIAILIIIAFVVGSKYLIHRSASSKTLKFMEPKKELTVEQFSADPFYDRDFAWDSENVPEFIMSDLKKAFKLNYDGVEYSFGENKVCVRKESSVSDELEVKVNWDFGWTMSNFSIYSYEENIVIYGYWNDEFRRITLGKTKESIVKDVLTLDPGVPFSANSKYISKSAKDDYIFVISKDMRTVSAYQRNNIVGEAVVLPDEILGFYNGIMILTEFDDYNHRLYIPYVIDNNGREEFVCIEIATVTAEEIENVADTEHIETFQSYTTRYYARIGDVCCYIFENKDGTIRMIVPNDIKKYSAYIKGTDILKTEDDLGWHWVTIAE